MSEWEIKKTTGFCYGSGEEIAIGADYFAALIETDEGFERRDYCCAFWEENKPQAFYFWKTKRADPEKKKQLFIDDDMLMAFFERLDGQSKQAKVNFRFVLALILMRKRLLRYESSAEKDGVDVWSMRVSGEKRIVEVIHPDLDDAQISELTENITNIMQSEDQ